MNASRLSGASRRSTPFKWQTLVLCLALVLIPWVMFLNYKPKSPVESNVLKIPVPTAQIKNPQVEVVNVIKPAAPAVETSMKMAVPLIPPKTSLRPSEIAEAALAANKKALKPRNVPAVAFQPVQGAVPTGGTSISFDFHFPGR